jgi:hypothetical protein
MFWTAVVLKTLGPFHSRRCNEERHLIVQVERRQIVNRRRERQCKVGTEIK